MEEHLAATDVAIIGGGVIGCALAYYLARGGVDTTLIDRREINREASGTNAGSLHLQIWMPSGGDDSWIDRVRPQLALHREAARHWPTLEAELETDLGVRIGGGFLVAETDADVDLLRTKNRAENAMGIETRLVEGSELRDLAPFLSTDLRAAAHHPGEGHANPLLVGPAFAAAAVQLGARLLTNAEVRAIERRSGGGFVVETARGRLAAGRIVDAAGAWADDIAAMVGLPLSMQRMSAIASVTEPAPAIMHGVLVQHVSRGLTLKQAPRGNFIIGGGWPASVGEAIGRKIAPLESIVGNLAVAAATVPAVRRLRLLRTWAGIGGDSMDVSPMIGESDRVRGFFVAESSFGFTLGPMTARLLSERMLIGETSLPIDAFSPNRF